MICLDNALEPLSHGGNIEVAAKKYGLPVEHWLDLSTGISPWSYPIPILPESVWRDLPPPNDDLLEVAKHYYQCEERDVVVTPGSQVSIRLIPQLLKQSSVAIPSIGYQEHAQSWSMAGHRVHYYQSADELNVLLASNTVHHVVIINPNNPSGEVFSFEKIKKIAQTVKGTLIVDEAFIDTFANQESFSSAVKISSDNVIVLRSVGKFFGLAGIRVGFAIGCGHPVLRKLNALLAPWSISHVSQYVVTLALSDREWKSQQRIRILEQSDRFEPVLQDLFNKYMTNPVVFRNTGLFHTVFSDQNDLRDLHDTLARVGVWTRLFNSNDNPAWLRFSLPRSVCAFQERVVKLERVCKKD